MKAEDRAILTAYRALFLENPTGRMVLEHMLVELQFFNTIDPDNAEQVTLHNYGKLLLKRLGVLDAEKVPELSGLVIQWAGNVKEFVRGLANISPVVGGENR